MTMTQHTYQGLDPRGFHRLAYTEWGRADNGRVLICVHGLTQNSRFLDRFADAMSDRYRVICPDVAGRGRSDWLAKPDFYNYDVYLNDMTALIARTGAEEVDWLGTSMGGLIGMVLAAKPNSPIRRLVLNDIGPFLPKAALERIGGYTGTAPAFASLAEAEAYMREVQIGMGALSDAQWADLARAATQRREDGSWIFAYDPAIGEDFRKEGGVQDVDMWGFWDRIACPVLALHGVDSDILLAETVEEMARRGPKADVIRAPGVGHPLPLLDADQIGPVRDWLLRDG